MDWLGLSQLLLCPLSLHNNVVLGGQEPQTRNLPFAEGEAGR